MDISLPYLVYNTKIIRETNPNERKIQAKTHNTKEGPSNNSSGGIPVSQGGVHWF